ncbi:hypothetical protein DN31_2969 [Vibrio mimicus]|nr:hypothetical protein DN31_2969 [Vibrio mimicus]BCN22324.1 hypothetical protein [Vibrio mimicus]
MHHHQSMKKKKSQFADAPPVASDINEANALIEELWEQLCHYEDEGKLKTSCSNSSKPSSSDGPKVRLERKSSKFWWPQSERI